MYSRPHGHTSFSKVFKIILRLFPMTDIDVEFKNVFVRITGEI